MENELKINDRVLACFNQTSEAETGFTYHYGYVMGITMHLVTVKCDDGKIRRTIYSEVAKTTEGDKLKR